MGKTLPIFSNRGRQVLPLLFLVFFSARCTTLDLSDPDKVPASVRDSLRARLYPLVAGAHAARDSVTSYRWELWLQAGETLYFGLSRPARSRFPGRREAVVGRAIPTDTGWLYYEELFWTYRFPAETLRAVVKGLFTSWKEGQPLSLFQERYVAFPDPYTFYSVQRRRWCRLIGQDTLCP